MRRKILPISGTLFSGIDMTGFAAVMLALVAMFVIPASIVVDLRGGFVDLAKVSHPYALKNAMREDAIFVAVQRDGSIWLNAEKTSSDSLPAAIRARVTQGAEAKVYVKADARASYASVAEVLDEVRSAGIRDVAFVLEEKKAPAAQ